jgi:hypothetical protein
VSQVVILLYWLLHAGFSLVFVDPEDGGNVILGNVDYLSLDYRELYR